MHATETAALELDADESDDTTDITGEQRDESESDGQDVEFCCCSNWKHSFLQ